MFIRTRNKYTNTEGARSPVSSESTIFCDGSTWIRRMDYSWRGNRTASPLADKRPLPSGTTERMSWRKRVYTATPEMHIDWCGDNEAILWPSVPNFAAHIACCRSADTAACIVAKRRRLARSPSVRLVSVNSTSQYLLFTYLNQQMVEL